MVSFPIAQFFLLDSYRTYHGKNRGKKELKITWQRILGALWLSIVFLGFIYSISTLIKSLRWWGIPILWAISIASIPLTTFAGRHVYWGGKK